MAGGWAHITDADARYTGADLMDTAGDVEDFARAMFGMVWWLAAQLAALEVSAAATPPLLRVAALPWVRVAAENASGGFALGGQAGGPDY